VSFGGVVTSTARVLDSRGDLLSPCPVDKARRLVSRGKATLVCEDPLTIQLPYAVDWPDPKLPASPSRAGESKTVLLHTCCGPCATYTVKHLREQGFQVSGFWYNPNVHPFAEHQRRLSSMEQYAESVGLPLVCEEGYELVEFLRAVVGREAYGERCQRCYEVRLARTAQVALREGVDAFTTTLLISPYQNQDLLRQAGEAAGEQYGVTFYFESFRRGWSETGRLAREHGLYRQQYCGCVYSEWERYSGQRIAPGGTRPVDE
jgi:predicted adenine nucleotide alpha hydrolase (AANH) superfamily ATPase